jgi:hypothetical protein
MADHEQSVAAPEPEQPSARVLPGAEPGLAVSAAAVLAARALPPPSQVIALQRAAGNRAVGILARRALLARAPVQTAEAEPTEVVPRDLEEVKVVDLKYVCVFGTHDDFGRGAREYAKTVMGEHKLIEASTMEDAVGKIVQHSRGARGANPAHISEIVLIAHANDEGRIKIPLVAGLTGTTVKDLAKLQQDFRQNTRKRFYAQRKELLDMFDSGTSIVVRGCRVGRNPQIVHALTAFFGGQASLYAAKDYQAFTAVKAGTSDAELASAYDHLADQGMVPDAWAYEEKDKAKWVRQHLPSGWVPEAFFVRDEDVARVRKARKGDRTIDDVKQFADSQNPSEMNERWAVGPTNMQGVDVEYTEMETDKLLSTARTHLDRLRELEASEPDNWFDIGEEAWYVRRAHAAWMTRSDAHAMTTYAADDPRRGDPLGGVDVLTMPGMSYDTARLAQQAGRREDLKPWVRDAFEETRLEVPLLPVREETDEDEDLDAAPAGPVAPGQQPAPVTYKRRPGSPAPKPKPPKPPTYVFNEDTLHSLPHMPETPVVVPSDEHAGGKADYALVVRGEFKRTFEFKYEPTRPIAGGWLLLKKAEVTFAGQLDFKGEGKREILVGALGSVSTSSMKPGASTVGGAEKAEGTIWSKKSDTGAFGTLKGGLELGGTEKNKPETFSERGMKAELYLSGEVGFGPVSTELKIVLIGIDETKSVDEQVETGTGPFKILGIKWSPLITTGGPIEIPLTDGTKAVFKGKMSVAFEAEPNWPKILAKVAEWAGRRAVVAEGAAVAGGGAAAGGGVGTAAAAVGAGELIVAGGLVAGGALTLYAYYKAVQEVENLKGLQSAADAGWDDFYGGFLSAVGIKTTLTRKGALWDEGARHGKIVLDWRVKSAARFLNDAHPDLRIKFTDDDPLVRDYLVGVIQNHKEQWMHAVQNAYEKAVRTKFYYAWRQKVGETEAEKDDLYARARAGLSKLEPNENPDYDWFKAM